MKGRSSETELPEEVPVCFYPFTIQAMESLAPATRTQVLLLMETLWESYLASVATNRGESVADYSQVQKQYLHTHFLQSMAEVFTTKFQSEHTSSKQ